MSSLHPDSTIPGGPEVELLVPFTPPGGARIMVPGHGPVFEDQAPINATLDYLRFVLDVAARSRDAGMTPLAAARETDLGRFAAWPDAERIVGNLHRACAELAGAPCGAAIDIAAALSDMVAYNGGARSPAWRDGRPERHARHGRAACYSRPARCQVSGLLQPGRLEERVAERPVGLRGPVQVLDPRRPARRVHQPLADSLLADPLDHGGEGLAREAIDQRRPGRIGVDHAGRNRDIAIAGLHQQRIQLAPDERIAARLPLQIDQALDGPAGMHSVRGGVDRALIPLVGK